MMPTCLAASDTSMKEPMTFSCLAAEMTSWVSRPMKRMRIPSRSMLR